MQRPNRKLFCVVDTHSFVDVITNSSTELFLCDTDKSPEVVREMLEKMLEEYNEREGTNLAFDYVFSPPRRYTEEEHRAYLRQETEYLLVYGDDDDDDDWHWGPGWGYEKEENIGKIIIEGDGDNSIPYELFEEINDTFAANNWHLS